jgi:hypothetical protein
MDDGMIQSEAPKTFAEREPELAAQIESVTVAKKNILAAIRELAGAMPQNGHVNMKKRIEEILAEE